MTTDGALTGKRVLIVEDRYLLADDMKRSLAEDGATILGPVFDLDTATELVRSGPTDLALLDIDLRGQMVFRLAETLDSLGIPFIFATGLAHEMLPARWAGRPFAAKPISAKRLRAMVHELLRESALSRSDGQGGGSG